MSNSFPLGVAVSPYLTVTNNGQTLTNVGGANVLINTILAWSNGAVGGAAANTKEYFEFQFLQAPDVTGAATYGAGVSTLANVDVTNQNLLATDVCYCRNDGAIFAATGGNLTTASGTWSPAATAQFDWGAIAVDFLLKKVWARNITQAAALGSDPRWNNGSLSTQNPNLGLGGFSLAGIGSAPYYASFAMLVVGASNPSAAMGLLYNFGQQPYLGIVPTNFSSYPPLSLQPNSSIIVQGQRPRTMPSVLHPISEPEEGPRKGLLTAEWATFFAQQVQRPGPIITIPTGQTSPFTFTSNGGGTFYISGGAVSDITIIRSGQGKTWMINPRSTSFSTGQTSGTFPMGKGDQIQITYTSQPQMNYASSF